MAKQQSKPVDFLKLRNAIEQRGLKLSNASTKMGRAETYLFHVAETKTLTISAIATIQAMFGVTYEDIKPDEPKPEPKPVPKPEPVTAELEVKESMSLADRICLDRLSKTVEDMRLTVNSVMLQLKSISDSMAKAVEFVDKPDFMYKALFVPVYNAIKAAEIENAANAEVQKRRIDGTPIPRGGKF